MTSEQIFLSQIIRNNDVYYKHMPKPWWFVDLKNRRLFTVIEEIIASGAVADESTVYMKEPSVIELESHSAANAEYYANKCEEAGKREELRKLSKIIGESVKRDGVDETISQIDDTLDMLLSSNQNYEIQSASELTIQIIDEIEERYKAKGAIPGIETGFQKLDNTLMGLQKSRLYIIGSRPSQGKSAIMLNIASHIGMGRPVGVLSLESSWKEMLFREVSSISKIDSQRLVSGMFSGSDFSRISNAASKIYESKIYIYDKPNCSIQEVVGQCRRMINKHHVEVIFIDYLQLINVPGVDNDRERVRHASIRLKDLSRELDIPIVVLAQLRRDSDGRRPHLGDFQHSSQIEQDADACILIYWQVVDKLTGRILAKNKADTDDEEVKIFLLIDKNRDGKTGGIPIHFQPEYLTFSEIDYKIKTDQGTDR